MSERAHLAADESHGEGGYLASMSDLMVGMLFVFIIMLMAFALSYRSAEDEHNDIVDKLEQQMDTLNSQLAGLQNVQHALSANQALRDKMLDTIRQRLQARGVDVSIEEAGVLRLREGLPFASGDADLRGIAADNARTLANVLAEIVPCYVSKPDALPRQCPTEARPILEGVFVEGHTDNVPIRGRYKDNWSLSTARASNTYEALRGEVSGLSALRNNSGKAVFGVSGYGEERPVSVNDSEDGRARNRRIDLRFLLAAPTAEQIERMLENVGVGRR